MNYADFSKYNLPKAEEIEFFFDIELKDSHQVLRDILKKADEKLEWFCSNIQDIIHSDSRMESLYEIDFLNEEKKQELFNIFKEFAAKRRKIHAGLLDYNEKKHAELINEVYACLQKYKEVMRETFLSLSKKWENNEKTNEDESKEYFG
jgi:hypothetical protein